MFVGCSLLVRCVLDWICGATRVFGFCVIIVFALRSLGYCLLATELLLLVYFAFDLFVGVTLLGVCGFVVVWFVVTLLGYVGCCLV